LCNQCLRLLAGLNVGRGYEVDPVGVHFDRRCSFASQPVEHLVNDLAPASGDFRRNPRIGEVMEGRPQVAIEGIDQNFESLLQRLMVFPVMR